MYFRRIVGSSMEPSFLEGDIVCFHKSNIYKEGHVVLAEVDGREVIKRIATIKLSSVYLLGDNSAASTDSREYGVIDLARVKAKCILRIPTSKLIAK